MPIIFDLISPRRVATRMLYSCPIYSMLIKRR